MKKHIALTLIILLILIVSLFFYFNKEKIEEVKEGRIEYFQLFHEDYYGVIDKKGNILIEPIYFAVVIPNLSKDVFFCYSDNIDFKVLNKDFLNENVDELIKLL